MVDISSVSGLSGTQLQQNIQRSSDKLKAVLQELSSGSQLGATDNVAALATATQLQSSNNTLNQAAANLGQASSLTQVASGGIQQITDALQQLQSLASQAGNPTLNSDNRTELNQQFQALASSIDQTVQTTNFNGQSLLNGSLSGDNSISLEGLLSSGASSAGDTSLSIPNLSTSGLFSGQSLSLLTSAGAQQASAAIGTALNNVLATQAGVGAFQTGVNYISANVETASANQQAAQSQLSDTDFAQASTDLATTSIQNNASIALSAQGNRLTPTLLKLVS